MGLTYRGQPVCQYCHSTRQVVWITYGQGEWEGWECEGCWSVVVTEKETDVDGTIHLYCPPLFNQAEVLRG